MSTDPQPEEEPKWRRRLGSAANNRAWLLSEMPSRSPDEDDEMLHAAHASLHLWRTIGTERNVALGHMLLGQVHSLLGNAVAANRFAQSSREYFVQAQSAPWELALAHAVAANAAHCDGNFTLHQTEYEAAQLAVAAISDAEEKEIVLATMRVVPKPAGVRASEG